MINAWELPTSLQVGEVVFLIRTDFRAILDILQYFSNPDYEDDEKWLICLDILYEDFENMPTELYQEAMQKAVEFIDYGCESSNKPKPRLMDWEQDASLIIPAVNRVIGHEVRMDSYMHWWTFLGAYMEIGECSFSHILNIRNKRAKGKKLEKWEEEYVRENRSVVELKTRLSEEQIAEEKRLEDLFG